MAANVTYWTGQYSLRFRRSDFRLFPLLDNYIIDAMLIYQSGILKILQLPSPPPTKYFMGQQSNKKNTVV